MDSLRAFACVLLLLAAASPASGQEPTPAIPAGNEPIRLFLDCSGFYCEPDFFQTEINFVSHVRNRQDADVHVLITQQITGGGGTQYTLAFIDQRPAGDGRETTLSHVTPPASSDDDRRRGLARVVKLGLMPFVAGTAVAERLEISYRAAPGTQGQAVTTARDPWNYWTFRSQINVNLNGESRSSASSMFGSLSASRTTEDWKIRFSSNGNNRKNRFEINDSTTIRRGQHGYGAGALVVRSIGPHLSAGLRGSGQSSTFLNQDLQLRFAPAVEYDIFPYSEATRRQLAFLYSVGVNQIDYRETTIFGKDEERLFDHNASVSLDLKQRWGSVNTTVEGSQYLHDLSKYRAELFTDLDVRLFKGLSLNTFASVSYVRNQLYLPVGNASTEEVLLRLRQLQTSYFYYTSIGVSYTFGSIYNTVVNPRFGGGRSEF